MAVVDCGGIGHSDDERAWARRSTIVCACQRAPQAASCKKQEVHILESRRRVRKMLQTSVSFVSSSLTTGISLLSISDKSAVDVVGDLDVDCALRYSLLGHFALVRHSAACGGWTLE